MDTGPFCLASLYEDCAPRHCGDGVSISFPFHIGGLQESRCGYPSFNLECNNNGSSVLQISGYNYSVANIDYGNKTIQLLSPPFTTCPSAVTNLTLDENKFVVYSSWELVCLMNCSKQLPQNLTRHRIGSCDQLVMLEDDFNLEFRKKVCSHVVVRLVDLRGEEVQRSVAYGVNHSEVTKRGFTIFWRAPDCDTCMLTGGRCGYFVWSFQLWCFCPNAMDNTMSNVRCPNGNAYAFSLNLKQSHK